MKQSEALQNPYLDEYLELSGGRLRMSLLESIELDVKIKLWQSRSDLVHRYAWAIPDQFTIQRIAEAAPRIVEIGAGTGYWAWMLHQAGADVVAYDAWAWPEFAERFGAWFPVHYANHSVAANHPDRALLLCWPNYDATWPAETLDRYTGDTLIYVGEGDGGCTGDDLFHQRLARDWRLIEERSIPKWPSLHDQVWLYERATVAAAGAAGL